MPNGWSVSARKWWHRSRWWFGWLDWTIRLMMYLITRMSWSLRCLRSTIGELGDGLKWLLELPHVELAPWVDSIGEGEGSLVKEELPACRLLMLRLMGIARVVMAIRTNIRKDFMFIIWKKFYGKSKYKFYSYTFIILSFRKYQQQKLAPKLQNYK